MKIQKYIVYDKDTGAIVAVIQPHSAISKLMPQYTNCDYMECNDDFKLTNKKINLSTKKAVNVITEAKLAENAAIDKSRAKRNALLTQSDWIELPSNTARFTDEVNTAWAVYREALRNIDMKTPIWPKKPS